jgi:hypothetical protein
VWLLRWCWRYPLSPARRLDFPPPTWQLGIPLRWNDSEEEVESHAICSSTWQSRESRSLAAAPSLCMREIWSLAAAPSLYAREIEWPLPTGAPDRHGLVKMQVDSGVLGHLVYDGVANNDSSRHQPLPPPSSSTAVVTSGLCYWRNGILGLGPAPWFCLAVVTDNRPWGGSQAPTTIWAEFGPGGRWPPVELVAQPLVVGPKAQVHVWLWAVGQFLPWAKRIDMVINLLSLIKSWCWYVITLVYFILKFCL